MLTFKNDPAIKDADKPKGWSLEKEGYRKVIRMDYFGQQYEAWEETRKKPDLAAAWDIVRRGFLSGGGGDPQVEDRRVDTLIEIQNNHL